MAKKNLLEFIRKVEAHIIYDRTPEKEIEKINSYREKLFQKYPRCFIKIKKRDGTEVPFFCVCNTNGTIDKNIISFYVDLLNRIEEFFDENELDTDSLEAAKRKLMWFYQRYSKEIPKDPMMSYKKARITKFINTLRKQ